MESLIETFHIDWKLLIAQVINFGVVFALLYIYALKPLMKKMKERSEQIEEGIKNADKNTELLENTHKEYKKTVAEAQNEAQRVLQNAKQDAEKKHQQMLADAQQEVDAIVARSKQEIERERTEALDAAKGEIAQLVQKATARVLSYAVTEEIDRELVNKSIEEVQK